MLLVLVVLMQGLLHLLLVLIEGVVAGAPVRAVVLHRCQDPLRPVLLCEAQVMLLAALTLVLLALHLACPQLQEVLVLVFGLLEVDLLLLRLDRALVRQLLLLCVDVIKHQSLRCS